jgi:hypothetical protein
VIDEICTYLVCALIIWMHSATLGELVAGVGIGWSAIFVIGLLQ